MPIALAIAGALTSIASSFAGRILLALGIGIATYTGIDTGMSWLTGQISAAFAGLPATVLAVLGLAKVGQGINMILSAMGARLVVNGISGGVLKKWIFK